MVAWKLKTAPHLDKPCQDNIGVHDRTATQDCTPTLTLILLYVTSHAENNPFSTPYVNRTGAGKRDDLIGSNS